MSTPVDSTMTMVGLGEVAERAGISKQAVSSKVKKAIKAGHDLPVEKDGRGRNVKVSLAHYQYYVGTFSNPAKTPPPSDQPEEDGKPSFDEARRQGEWQKVTAYKLRLAENSGQLLRADIVAEALTTAGRTIQAEVARIQNQADAVALAVSKEGTSGARTVLRKFANKLNNSIADALEKIALDGAERDPALEDEEQ